MIKTCKQCGSVLKADESNNVCSNCRKDKKNRQEEMRLLKAELKKRKYNKG